MAWRKTSKQFFFSAIVEQERAFDRRSALRESLLSIWRVDTHQALRECEDRHVEVDASDASYFSWDRTGDLCPAELLRWVDGNGLPFAQCF